MSRKVSLAEIMGKTGETAKRRGLQLSDLPEILGDAHPELPKDSVGRHRLVRALKARFGPNFRALPGVTGLLKEFDAELAMEHRIAQIKQIKYKPKGR